MTAKKTPTIQQTSSSSAQQLYCPLYALAGQPDGCRRERCAWWRTDSVQDTPGQIAGSCALRCFFLSGRG